MLFLNSGSDYIGILCVTKSQVAPFIKIASKSQSAPRLPLMTSLVIFANLFGIVPYIVPKLLNISEPYLAGTSTFNFGSKRESD